MLTILTGSFIMLILVTSIAFGLSTSEGKRSPEEQGFYFRLIAFTVLTNDSVNFFFYLMSGKMIWHALTKAVKEKVPTSVSA